MYMYYIYIYVHVLYIYIMLYDLGIWETPVIGNLHVTPGISHLLHHCPRSGGRHSRGNWMPYYTRYNLVLQYIQLFATSYCIFYILYSIFYILYFIFNILYSIFYILSMYVWMYIYTYIYIYRIYFKRLPFLVQFSQQSFATHPMAPMSAIALRTNTLLVNSIRPMPRFSFLGSQQV